MASKWFLRFATLFAVSGMGLGIYMAASFDHALSPVHAHVNLIGWVGMFLAGLFYAVHPGADDALARIHLGTAVTGLLILAPGIAGSHFGLPWGPAVAGLGSILTIATMILFAAIVFRTTAGARSSAGTMSARGLGAAE